MEQLHLVIRLLAATVCGGLIGLEREMHGRVAGLRTHILVCMGSCLMMLVSIYVFTLYGSSGHADPGRIAAQVVSGIGFLGAGTILRFRASVRGLTTAASLWAVSGIGLACGIGLYWGAVLTTALVLVTLFLLSKAEQGVIRKSWYRELEIEFSAEDPKHMERVKEVLSRYPMEIKDFNIRKTAEGRSVIVFSLKLLTDRHNEDIRRQLSELPNSAGAHWVEEE